MSGFLLGSTVLESTNTQFFYLTLQSMGLQGALTSLEAPVISGCGNIQAEIVSACSGR